MPARLALTILEVGHTRRRTTTPNIIMSDLDTGGPSAGGLAPDDFADQYNDFSVPDPFAVDLPPAPPSRKRPSGANAISSLGLGIGLDEEVVVAKKPRLIVPKFDESLLLDKDKGIPKLQERAKKLRFKGKGHEFSDCQRMLEMYQLWLNNLYPKARFLDCAGMVERLGHKSRVIVARQGWIKGWKVLGDGPDMERVGDDGLFDDPMLPPRDTSRLMQQNAAIFTNTRERAEAQRAEGRARGETTPQRDAPDDLDIDDLFDATPVKKSAPAPAAKSIFGGEDDIPSDDDLDALMAEQEMNSAPPPAKKLSDRINQRRDATAQSQSGSIFGAPSKAQPQQQHDDDFPEDDDLDALMAEADMNSQPSRAAPSTSTSIFGPPKSAPAQNDQDDEMDDLDALLAEQDDNTSAKKPEQKKALAVEEEEADYDAMFEETEKLHDTLDKVVEKAKDKEEKENMGVDEDEMDAMGDMW